MDRIEYRVEDDRPLARAGKARRADERFEVTVTPRDQNGSGSGAVDAVERLLRQAQHEISARHRAGAQLLGGGGINDTLKHSPPETPPPSGPTPPGRGVGNRCREGSQGRSPLRRRRACSPPAPGWR